jgi:hypothetical protein
MRRRSFASLAFRAAALSTAPLTLAVVGFAGCGGTIDILNGSASGSSSSGSPASSSSGSGFGGASPGTTVATVGTGFGGSTGSIDATVATSSSSSGAGTGGGSPCDMACAHVQQCFGIDCATVGLNCANLGSGFDCIAECINDTPCADLSQSTLQTCQAQCSAPDGGAPDAASSPDSGSAASCIQCSAMSCGTQELACEQNATCKQWLQCVGGCYQQTVLTPGCFQACDAQYPSAAADYSAIYTCACQSCPDECSQVNPCAAGTDAGP